MLPFEAMAAGCAALLARRGDFGPVDDPEREAREVYGFAANSEATE